MKRIGKYIIVIMLLAFALLTLFLSSSVIFDWFGIREKEGDYVLFVVQSNFMSSVLYIIAASGLINNKKWTIAPLLISVIILIVAQIGLHYHIDAGGLYEEKTVKAMYFRIIVTLVFSVIAFISYKRNTIK
jgi:hypothetical protein